MTNLYEITARTNNIGFACFNFDGENFVSIKNDGKIFESEKEARKEFNRVSTRKFLRNDGFKSHFKITIFLHKTDLKKEETTTVSKKEVFDI